MAPSSRSKNEKKIQQLMEMGCSRAAAKSSLRANKWDVEEAGMAVFDDKHQDALDIPIDDELDQAATVASTPIPSSARDVKGKGREVVKLPTPEGDEDDDEQAEYGDDEDMDMYSNNGGDEGGATFEGSEVGSADCDYGDGDAYGFLNTSKDRTETITEVEEPARKVWISLSERGEYAKPSDGKGLVEAELFGLGRWLSGCPEGNEQQQLFPLYNTLAGDSFAPSNCPYNCGAPVPHYESDFFSVLPDFKIYLERLVQVVQTKCMKCSGLICLACGEACSPPTGEEKVENDKAPTILLHCPQLQAVILGVGLYSAEKLWEDANALPETSKKSKKRKVSPAAQDHEIDSDDSDYGLPPPVSGAAAARRGNYKAGVGYGGARGMEDESGMKAAIKLQQERDQSLATLLAKVRVYLPNRDRPGPFKNSDHMPAGQTLAHLRRRFNPIASLLLSAESLSDMSERKELYTEFMAWLEVMSAHENLAGLMGQPIMRPSSITYSQAIPVRKESTSAAAGKRREKIIVFKANPGPRELLERIMSQVKVAYRVAKAAKARDAASAQANSGAIVGGNCLIPTDPSMSTASGAVEARRLMDFCETIEKAVTKIDRALKQSKGGAAVLRSMNVSVADEGGSSTADVSTTTITNGKGKFGDIAKLSDGELKERYESWVNEVKYGHCNWEMPEKENMVGVSSELGPSYKHYYNKEARVISSYPARNTALMKEHMRLSDSLPSTWGSSVFLKTDENRPDIIKALITGPDETPYENGCFLFDILLPGSYNQTPPSVKSMTTKGGAYRLNPNLYAEGKVCLSLLGTWSGPGWVAGKSTLLQVLVSIQAMILWAEPIANEPGFEKDLGNARSKAYNANVRRMVVHIAMLEYLKNPPEGFEEIVQTHFRFKARSIRKQLDKWVKEDDKQRLSHDSMSSLHGTHAHPHAAAGAAAGGAAAPAGQESGAAFIKDVEAVNKYLDKLEAGEVLSTASTSS